MTNKMIFVGTIVSPTNFCKPEIYNGFVGVENGKITKIGTKQEYEQLHKDGAFTDFMSTFLKWDQLLMPGFVDCHTHAPQFPNIGLGLDKPLLEWLETYTFPLEKMYGDIEFATKVYDKVVQRLLSNGTTTACYFGTIHMEGTLQLVDSVVKHKQRALVGKVSMNVKNNEDYYNETLKEIAEVEEFVKKVQSLQNDLVQPVVTPRFAVSCDTDLMCGLAQVADKYNCFVQSHISENLKEIEYVLSKNPDCKSYAGVYDSCNLLNNRCIMAHAVHLNEEEMTLLQAKGVSIAHCPASNTRLQSGLCPVLKLRDRKLTVGLGTDVSGGDNASILDAMRRAMDVSTYVGGGREPIAWYEAFYMATLGGAEALKLPHKIGSFEVGKDFDALLIDVYAKDSPVTRYEGFPTFSPGGIEYAESILQRFIYVGDDRNIVQVYVKGEKVKDVL